MEGTSKDIMSKVEAIKYGICATFNSAKDLYDAAGQIRDDGYSKWECFTPIPVHGLDAQMGIGRSKVPVFTLIGGVTGFFTGMLIVWFMNSYDYPLIVGGNPTSAQYTLSQCFMNLQFSLQHLAHYLVCFSKPSSPS